jgi:hypothetical protein
VVRPIGPGWRRFPTPVPGTEAKRPAYQYVVVVDDILGRTSPVTREEIRIAWSRPAKVHDPRKGGDPATYRRLCEVRNRAYQQLRWQGVTRQPMEWGA